MAEFPHLGQQCFECKTLDFLPLICNFCKAIFCKDHHSVDGHKCPNYSTIDNSSNSCRSESIHGKCCFCKNSVPDIELVLCDKCNKKYCLVHRHQNSHQCNESDVKKATETQSTKLVLNSCAPNIKGAKNEALSRKVALMKLKQTAVGNSSLPMTERLYFNISYQKDSQLNQFDSKAIFLSKEWSVGKCVDWLATQLGLINNNNNPLLPKLVLSINNDNCEPFSFSFTLKHLENESLIQSGDKLLLKYN